MKKTIYLWLVWIGLLLTNFVAPKAAYSQYYGNDGDKPVVVLDKKIQLDNNYVDNVSTSQKIYVQGDQIVFKILIENKGTTILHGLKLVDYLPDYLTMLFYPGKYTDGKLEIDVPALNAGDTKEYLVVGRISQVPTGNSRLNMQNQACIKNVDTGDCDKAWYYIGLKSMPVTGGENIIFGSMYLLTGLVAAVGLRKFARGY